MAQINKVTVTRFIVLNVTVTLFLTISTYAAEPIISRVSLSQKVIDLTRGEKALIKFQLSEKSSVGLEIYDEDWNLIRRLTNEKQLKKGSRSLAWDGRDANGEQVRSGVYVYVLEARGKHPYRFDPSKTTGGEEVIVEKLSWDVPKGKIKYLLPKASYARVRIGVKEGVFLGTLEDWTPLEAGERELPWTGRDPSGHFDLSSHPEAQMNITAFALPDNVVIVTGGSPRKTGTVPVLSIWSGREKQGGGKCLHSPHPRTRCHEPKFRVEFPGAELDPETQVPIFKDKVPLRITIDPEDKDYLVSNRFEIMFFSDLQFLFEQEEATSPLTAQLDTSVLGQGEHLITINVMDYQDHIGVETVKILIASPAKSVIASSDPKGLLRGGAEQSRRSSRRRRQSSKSPNV